MYLYDCISREFWCGGGGGSPLAEFRSLGTLASRGHVRPGTPPFASPPVVTGSGFAPCSISLRCAFIYRALINPLRIRISPLVKWGVYSSLTENWKGNWECPPPRAHTTILLPPSSRGHLIGQFPTSHLQIVHHFSPSFRKCVKWKGKSGADASILVSWSNGGVWLRAAKRREGFHRWLCL